MSGECAKVPGNGGLTGGGLPWFQALAWGSALPAMHCFRLLGQEGNGEPCSYGLKYGIKSIYSI
jgi:hypothetical protein